MLCKIATTTDIPIIELFRQTTEQFSNLLGHQLDEWIILSVNDREPFK